MLLRNNFKECVSVPEQIEVFLENVKIIFPDL